MEYSSIFHAIFNLTSWMKGNIVETPQHNTHPPPKSINLRIPQQSCAIVNSMYQEFY